MLLTVSANTFPSLDRLTSPPNQSPALPIKSSPTCFSIVSGELENSSKVDELPTVVQVISSTEDSHLMVKSPVPSGSSESLLILYKILLVLILLPTSGLLVMFLELHLRTPSKRVRQFVLSSILIRTNHLVDSSTSVKH